ncbi:MAG TPA: helix-turn-helix domain-containing protein [Rhizomicrobium sp.]|jgi:DNA-binding IclR family transcriptional regulator|nr:helix-turn-helix domain-containing protein [Rhizomicrobium sp.]
MTIKSAVRVFEVLELFERERRPLTLKDICGAFGYAPSSGAALLKSLVALGYLDYAREKHSVRRGVGIVAMLLAPGTLSRTAAIGVAGAVARLEEKQAPILAALRRGIAAIAQGAPRRGVR